MPSSYFFSGCLRYPEIYVPLRQTIFGNSHKSFGTKSWEYSECSISVIIFWTRKCLTENALWSVALSWCIIRSLGQNSGIFYAQLQVTALALPHNELGWLFGLEEWFKCEQYSWCRRKWWALSSSVISTCKLFLGHGVVDYFHFTLCNLLSVSYWKHRVSSSVISFTISLKI